MRIWDNKKSLAIIFIFMVNFSFGFSSNKIASDYAKVQAIEERSHFLQTSSKDFPIGDHFLRNSKISENETFSFTTLYNYLNPQSVIEAGLTGKNIKIAILDSGINNTP